MNSLNRAIRNLLQLPLIEQWFLLRAWALMGVIDVALRLVPFHWLLAWCRQTRAANMAGAHTISIARAAQLVEIAGRHHICRQTCLTETLTLSRLLGQRGVDTAVQIGVAGGKGCLAAHAWLELHGRVIIGETSATFVPLQPLPRGRS